jgi:hypothetical protein
VIDKPHCVPLKLDSQLHKAKLPKVVKAQGLAGRTLSTIARSNAIERVTSTTG